MLLGEGWPWWSAQAVRDEPARAKPTPAAVRMKSRRVGFPPLKSGGRKIPGLVLGDFRKALRFIAITLFQIAPATLQSWSDENPSDRGQQLPWPPPKKEERTERRRRSDRCTTENDWLSRINYHKWEAGVRICREIKMGYSGRTKRTGI